MTKTRATSSPFGVALVIFLIGIAGALLTGTTALLIWLSQWVGLIGASLILCALFIVMATLSYLLVLRQTINRISARFTAISRVASLIQNGYDWVLRKSAMLLQLVEDALDRI